MNVKISGMTAVSGANLDDTALLEVVDNAGNTRKSTFAQLRTAVAAAAIAFLSTVSAAGAMSALNYQLNAVGGALGGSVRYIDGGGTSSAWQYNVPTGGSHAFSVNNVNQAIINASSTALQGDVQVAAASTGTFNLVLGPGTPSANNTGIVKFLSSNSTKNWQISVNNFVSGAFEIAASTAGGGTTFTTALFSMKNDGTLTLAGQVNFGSSLTSTTALATPGAYAATTGTFFASTVNGAAQMGFGSTYDSVMMNRSGTAVIGVVANTSNAQVNGLLTVTNGLTASGGNVTISVNDLVISGSGQGITNATTRYISAVSGANPAVTFASTGGHTFSSGITVNGVCQLGTAAGANLITIGGTAYGAATASLRMNGLTSGAAAGVGTLTNAPASTNPNFWMPISIAGTVRYIPCW